MERLLKDASALKQAQGEYADYSIDSFADIVEAIHVVQDNMGITGTTAKEAATTIEGSINSAKAAWQNWLTGLANPDADMSTLSKQLVEAVKTAVANIVPASRQIVKGLFDGVVEIAAEVGGDSVRHFIDGFKTSFESGGIAQLIGVFQKIFGSIKERLGGIFSDVSPNFDGVVSSVDTAAGKIAEAIDKAFTWITEHQTEVTTALAAIGAGFAGIKIAEGIGNAVKGFGTITSLVSKLGGLFSIFTAGGPLGIAVGLIAALAGGLAVFFTQTEDGKAIWEELSQKIGEFIDRVGPIVSGVIKDAIERLSTAAQELWTAAQPLLDSIGEAVSGALNTFVTDILPGLIDMAKNVMDIVKELAPIVGTVVQALAPVIGIVVLAVIDGITLIFNAITAFLDWLNNDPAGQAIKDVISGIVDAIVSAVEIVSGVFTTIVGFIQGIATGDWSKFAEGIGSTFDGVGDLAGAITGIFDGLLRFVANIPGMIIGFLSTLPGMIIDFFGGLFGQISQLFGGEDSEANPIVKPFVDAINAIVAFFQENPLGQAISTAVEGIFEIIGGIWDFTKGIFDTIVGFIGGLITGDFTQFSNGIQGILDGLAGVFNGIVDFIRGLISTAVSYITLAFTSAVEFVSTIPGKIADFLASLPEKIGAIFESVKNTAIDIFNGIVDFISGIPDKIANFFWELPGKIAEVFSSIHIPQLHIDGEFNLDPLNFKLPDISFYGAGGFTNGGQLYVAGERGTEFIWPEYNPYFGKYADALAQRIDSNGRGDTYVIFDNNVINDPGEIEQQFIRSAYALARKRGMYLGTA